MVDYTVFEKMDWSLLRKQKLWLLTTVKEHPEAEGLVHLLDGIQDFAHEELGIREVFITDVITVFLEKLPDSEKNIRIGLINQNLEKINKINIFSNLYPVQLHKLYLSLYAAATLCNDWNKANTLSLLDFMFRYIPVKVSSFEPILPLWYSAICSKQSLLVTEYTYQGHTFKYPTFYRDQWMIKFELDQLTNSK